MKIATAIGGDSIYEYLIKRNYEVVPDIPYQKGIIEIVKKDFIAEGGPEKEVALCAEKEISLLLKIGEEELCEKEFIMHDNISLPLKAGDTVGEIVITLGGKVAGKTNVVVTQDIMPLTFESSFKKILKCWLGINAA